MTHKAVAHLIEQVVLRRLAPTLLLLVSVAAASCGNDNGDCPSGFTDVCLPDGTTCACAPSCSGTDANSCSGYTMCKDSSCAACTPETCTCSTNVCVPHAWSGGQTVSFKRN